MQIWKWVALQVCALLTGSSHPDLSNHVTAMCHRIWPAKRQGLRAQWICSIRHSFLSPDALMVRCTDKEHEAVCTHLHIPFRKGGDKISMLCMKVEHSWWRTTDQWAFQLPAFESIWASRWFCIIHRRVGIANWVWNFKPTTGSSLSNSPLLLATCSLQHQQIWQKQLGPAKICHAPFPPIHIKPL